MKTHYSVQVIFAALIAGACGDGSPSERQLDEVLHVSLGQSMVDILFVAKSSACGQDDQEALQENIQRLTDSFASFERAPSIHIGVATTDMGTTEDFGITGCVGNGDDGLLIVPDSSPELRCGLSSDNFLSIDLAGNAENNFDGTIEEALSCLLDVGIFGCAFEQPLAAMKRALSADNSGNAGFLRSGADLAVIIISDEDDCSAADPSFFFDPEAAELSALYGGFRCFDHGVACDQQEVDTPGVKTGCRAVESSPYFEDVEVFADFLKTLKSGPKQVSVVAIAGTSSDGSLGSVEIVSDSQGNMEVGAGCERGDGYGLSAPGIRLGAFAEAMGAGGRFISLCNSVGDTLFEAGSFIQQRTVGHCIAAQLVDVDTKSDGAQFDCEVVLEQASGVADEEVLPCGSEVQSECWKIESDASRCGLISPAALRVVLVGTDLEQAGGSLRVRCATEVAEAEGDIPRVVGPAFSALSEPYVCPVEEF